MVRGKRICRSLKTADESLARLRAREILKLARDEQFGKLDEVRSGRDVAKLGDVLEAYRTAAATP